ncbi:uncharacterized protein LOC106094600 [Stomoxys calcitrans]|uniref:DUF7027 domain-containing protein n=1 Tax=Stomoxys calcitrans TaxID=35570 RepID=A0A1I8QCW5_STOCA|nr:uncharacterized protein LOC106094600 [Stomoxys calcitrans]
MHPFQDDALDRMGKVIGYTQVYLFTILLMYVCYTFRTSACTLQADDPPSNVCLGTVALTLTMLAISVSLAVGISLRHAYYLLPWLIMSVFTVILISAYLVMYGNLFLAVLGSLILFMVMLSWYPSFRLYQRYRCESRSELNIRSTQSPLEEVSPLYGMLPSSSLPKYSDVVRDPLEAYTVEPPAYDEIIIMKGKSLVDT